VSDLSETQAWMRWWGWTGDGSPGSLKLDVDERVIAKHGDATWHADVDKGYRLARADRAARCGDRPARSGEEAGRG
jgi:hypothetical protein